MSMIEQAADAYEDRKRLEKLEKAAIKNVWVLVIDHEHGTNISAHATEDGAKYALYEYCREWWDDAISEQYGKLADLSRDAAIDAYFDCHNTCLDSEWYILEESKIEN